VRPLRWRHRRLRSHRAHADLLHRQGLRAHPPVPPDGDDLRAAGIPASRSARCASRRSPRARARST
jgi:hypothetical protein